MDIIKTEVFDATTLDRGLVGKIDRVLVDVRVPGWV